MLFIIFFFLLTVFSLLRVVAAALIVNTCFFLAVSVYELVQLTRHFNFFCSKVYDKFLREATADDIVEALEVLRESDLET